MTTADPAELTIAQASDMIAASRLSPVELVQAMLTRIEKGNKALHAYITVCGDEALQQARDAEREITAGRSRSPLHGIPYALKDIFLTRGVRTTANSRVAPQSTDTDAVAHSKLRDAGAILLGKLNTYEFGMGVGTAFFDLPTPPARNPWNLQRFTGSTTTGGGVAVAAGLASVALGTDTGGSVRLPASACGVVGIKPTYGRVSTRGIIPNTYSLDHVGTLTRSVADAALVLQAVAGYDPQDRTSADVPVPNFSGGLGDGVKGLKIGFIRRFHECDVAADPRLSAAIDEAVLTLRNAGAQVVTIESKASLTDYRSCMSIINTCEAYAAHRAMFQTHYERLGEGFRRKMLAGIRLSAADYIDAQRWRGELADELDRLIIQHDAIVCAGTTSAAPVITDSTAVANFTTQSAMAAFNLSGHPALSICIGFTNDNMPLGMQIAANHFDEQMLFRVAAAYERATIWHERKPAYLAETSR
jgi:aspartyl-tRNA(Asn)/glutamyl-tRNA(Gln) amidotransferase subunit A